MFLSVNGGKIEDPFIRGINFISVILTFQLIINNFNFLEIFFLFSFYFV